MHLSSMYYIIFIVAVILASILILFTHWRYKVWQRESGKAVQGQCSHPVADKFMAGI